MNSKTSRVILGIQDDQDHEQEGLACSRLIQYIQYPTYFIFLRFCLIFRQVESKNENYFDRKQLLLPMMTKQIAM